jgi:hypothetical protein
MTNIIIIEYVYNSKTKVLCIDIVDRCHLYNYGQSITEDNLIILNNNSVKVKAMVIAIHDICMSGELIDGVNYTMQLSTK